MASWFTYDSCPYCVRWRSNGSVSGWQLQLGNIVSTRVIVEDGETCAWEELYLARAKEGDEDDVPTGAFSLWTVGCLCSDEVEVEVWTARRTVSGCVRERDVREDCEGKCRYGRSNHNYFLQIYDQQHIPLKSDMGIPKPPTKNSRSPAYRRVDHQLDSPTGPSPDNNVNVSNPTVQAKTSLREFSKFLISEPGWLIVEV